MFPTAGMQTSEFFVTLLPLILGGVLSIIGALTHDSALVTAGAAMATGSGGLYAVSRGIAKQGTATPPNTEPAQVAPDAAAKAISKL